MEGNSVNEKSYVELDEVEKLISLFREILLCDDEHYSLLREEMDDKIKYIRRNAEVFE